MLQEKSVTLYCAACGAMHHFTVTEFANMTEFDCGASDCGITNILAVGDRSPV